MCEPGYAPARTERRTIAYFTSQLGPQALGLTRPQEWHGKALPRCMENVLATTAVELKPGMLYRTPNYPVWREVSAVWFSGGTVHIDSPAGYRSLHCLSEVLVRMP
jgi:hypothetical protein